MKEKEEKLYWWKSNYSWREKWNFLKYRIQSPCRALYKEIPSLMSESSVVLAEETPNYSIVFLGDFMPLGRFNLLLSDTIKEFVGTADTLVVNLEGVITEEKRLLALSHDLEVLKVIQSLNAHNILINVANNHASDFGREAFAQQLRLLRKEGFDIVGYDTSPFILNDQFLFEASSLWSNQSIDTVPRFSLTDSAPSPSKKGYYNMFLPHWGYEMELFPRAEQILYAEELLQKGWDAVIGNHPHCPQPVEVHEQKVVAYSLGNFCYSNSNPNHWYGMALKLSFRLGASLPKLCRIERLYTLQRFSFSSLDVIGSHDLDYDSVRKGNLRRWSYMKDLLK